MKNVTVITIGHKPINGNIPFVKKPIRDFNLKQAVMRCVMDVPAIPMERPKKAILDESIDYNIPILVAEDNVLNQVFSQNFLRNN